MPSQQACWRRSSNFQSLLANAASSYKYGLSTAHFPTPRKPVTWQVPCCCGLVVTCCISIC